MRNYFPKRPSGAPLQTLSKANTEVPGDVRYSKVRRQVQEKLVSTLEHLKSPKVGQDQVSGGVIKRPLLACVKII